MALTAETEVANLCLIRIGEDPLTDLDGQTGKVASVMRAAFGPSRDSLLRQYRWNFAMGRASLAASGSPTFGFENSFTLPDDCLHVVGLFDENEDLRNYTASKIAFKVEGRSLLCDEDTVYIYYVKSITNVRLFDPLFVDALAWKLGIDTAYGLTTGPDHVANCWKGFKEVMRYARLANAIEGSVEAVAASDWLDARHSAGPGPFRAGPINW